MAHRFITYTILLFIETIHAKFYVFFFCSAEVNVKQFSHMVSVLLPLHYFIWKRLHVFETFEIVRGWIIPGYIKK